MTQTYIIETIRSKMKKAAPWAKTILFGSQARGDAKTDSDIDLLILIPDNLKSEFNKLRSQIADILFEIELENDILISPLILLQEMWVTKKTPFTYNVNTEGIEL